MAALLCAVLFRPGAFASAHFAPRGFRIRTPSLGSSYAGKFVKMLGPERVEFGDEFRSSSLDSEHHPRNLRRTRGELTVFANSSSTSLRLSHFAAFFVAHDQCLGELEVTPSLMAVCACEWR